MSISSGIVLTIYRMWQRWVVKKRPSAIKHSTPCNHIIILPSQPFETHCISSVELIFLSETETHNLRAVITLNKKKKKKWMKESLFQVTCFSRKSQGITSREQLVAHYITAKLFPRLSSLSCLPAPVQSKDRPCKGYPSEPWGCGGYPRCPPLRVHS